MGDEGEIREGRRKHGLHPRKVDLAAIVPAHGSRTHRKGGRWKRRKLEISGQGGSGCVTGNVLLAPVAALSLHVHPCPCIRATVRRIARARFTMRRERSGGGILHRFIFHLCVLLLPRVTSAGVDTSRRSPYPAEV